MQRSGSQKALLVFSILNIIGAVIALVGGIAMMMGGILVETVDPAETAAVVAETGLTQSEIGVFAGMIGIVLIFDGIIELIMGILGIRASNDNQKIMPVWVLAIIQLILCVASLITIVVNGTFASQGMSQIISILFAVIILWLANNIKREAGK